MALRTNDHLNDLKLIENLLQQHIKEKPLKKGEYKKNDIKNICLNYKNYVNEDYLIAIVSVYSWKFE
jgi:hypothetical protein